MEYLNGSDALTLDDAVDDLRATLGDAAVDTSRAARERSSHDTWPLATKESMSGRHPHQADAVVTITSFEQAPQVFEIAAAHGVPVTVRALGSSVTGQPLPVHGGIVLDVSAVTADCRIDERNMTVAATASFNGGALEDFLAERGYTLGHSPQSLYRSTIGGWVATLATGQFSSMYGGIEDLVTGYTVVLATGETARLQASPRAAMGPDLRQIFLGSEGTLGLVTSVTMKIFRRDLPTLLESFALSSVDAGLEVMREQAILGLRPFLLRLYDADEAQHLIPGAALESPILLAGARGPAPVARAELSVLTQLVADHGGHPTGPALVERWMGRRFDFSAIEKQLARTGGFAETIEVAHNWSGIHELYRALKAALTPLCDDVLAHFSHVYTQGTSMYVIVAGQVDSDTAAVERLRWIWDTAMRVCLSHGAELSHHHGGGLARSPYARRSLGSAHIVLQKIKAALDPAGILNPGKLGL
jgi:alkyldihydroxyacetonephosphate synthase